MPTYRQYNSFSYNLMSDSREPGDFLTITREQRGRSTFARDQALAASAAGFDRTTMLRQASRGNSTLRNLHHNMDNTDDTGGFGGLGYATGRGGVATQDLALPSEGNAVKCLIEMGKLAGNESDYFTLSQDIAKPNSAVYGRFMEAMGNGIFVTTVKVSNPDHTTSYYSTLSQGPADPNVYTDGRGVSVQNYPTTRIANKLIYVSHTDTETTILARNTHAGGLGVEVVLPISLDETVTYWFVQLHDKVNQKQLLIAVPYASCLPHYFEKGLIVNNYPNVPLSRTAPYDQNHIDTYKGDIATYPSDEERDAYIAANQPELDSIAADRATQEALLAQCLLDQEAVLDDLTDLPDDEQDYVTSKYFGTALPVLVELGLDPYTYTQADLDATVANALSSWRTYLINLEPEVTPVWDAQKLELGYSLNWLDILNSVPAAIDDFVTQIVPTAVRIYWEVTDDTGAVTESERVLGNLTIPIAALTYTEAVAAGVIAETPGLVEVSSVLVFESEDAAYYLLTKLNPKIPSWDATVDRYKAYTFTPERVSLVEDMHVVMASFIPAVPPLDSMHRFATAIPYMDQEELISDAISVLYSREYAILANIPNSPLASNKHYSEWGEWTFFRDYRNKFDHMYETFMSEGFPQHDEVKRFLAMTGQKPRVISDVIRAATQSDPEGGGNTETQGDQLMFGCQAGEKMSYAEMRYMVEFIRATWWHTPFSTNGAAGYESNERIYNYGGQSAWGVQHIEETIMNPGAAAMKSQRTVWGNSHVWIEQGNELSNGEFGYIEINTDTTNDDSRPTYYHDDEDWAAEISESQQIVAKYNLGDGYTLHVLIQDLATLHFVDTNHSRLSINNFMDYPNVPLLYNIVRGIPQMQICQLGNEFFYIRSHTYWQQHRSSWVNFRDRYLMKIVGLVIAVVGIVLAIPSGGFTLTWTSAGIALMYAVIYYAAVKVISHFLKQWGLDNTWIGAVFAVVVAIVGVYFGMPPTDAAYLGVTMSADAMTSAYAKATLAEAKEAAGLMAKYDQVMEEVYKSIDELEEDQKWLDFYSASDLVKMRQDAVEYVRTETPDKYFNRMLDFNDNKLDLNGLDYQYDFGLDLDLA